MRMKLSLSFKVLFIGIGLGLTNCPADPQDGAGYNPAAAQYRPPEQSLSGGADSPQLDAAIVSILSGDSTKGISILDKLARQGDVKAAIFLGNLFRAGKSPISADKVRAAEYFRLGSDAGAGEASEYIASMLEHHEIPSVGNRSAEKWRKLAVQQGWIQQELHVVCLEWVHGPEQLQCVAPQSSSASEAPENGCPSQSELSLLRVQGMTGTLHRTALHVQKSDGPAARATLIMDRQVIGEQDLKQPYAASVFYVLRSDQHWQMMPSDAPLINRYIIVKADLGGAGISGVMAQNADGSSSGGVCAPSNSH